MRDVWLRRIYRILFPERTRNYLGLYKYLYEDGANPTILTDFSADKIVVLSPHFDDDVIGCGGTIRLFKKQGCQVTVVYLTDGRKGNPALDRMSLSKAERKAMEDALVTRRKEEARRAAEFMDIDRLIFFDLPDSEFTCTPSSVKRMFELLEEESPDAVFLPFLTEKQRDHRMTNTIFCNVLKMKRFEFTCYGYEVWTALLPNCLVNITGVLDDKKTAVGQHKSQLEHCDFIRAITCLNGYRSMVFFEGPHYAEAFYRANTDLYRFLYRQMR
jgi:LmbE family N-acetylglucosaminyl deacetylase